MKEMILRISEDCFAKLQAEDRRFKGSLGFEPTGDGKVLSFHMYKKSNQQKQSPQKLISLPSGSLKKTARKYRLQLSVNDELGEMRAAEELKRDSEEACQFLRHLSNILGII